MSKKRLQLTLFVEEDKAEVIEKVREKYNPEQYKLIKSHVTLCRENELKQIETVLQTLKELNHNYITIFFGCAERFSNGKGVLIPATESNEQFQKLRETVLKGVIKNPEKHQPHITLMHPRNATCTDAIFEQIKKFTLPHSLEFKKISVIEQEDANSWNILKEFQLKNIRD